MKNENEFNAHLSRGLKKLSKGGFSYLKISDRFHQGVSDFLVWHRSGTRSAAIECKFIEDLPVRPSTRLLKHEFKGAQASFFKRMEPAEIPCWGLVGIKSLKSMFLIKDSAIPESGNWTKSEFFAMVRSERPLIFDIKDVGQMAFSATHPGWDPVATPRFTDKPFSYNEVISGQISWD